MEIQGKLIARTAEQNGVSKAGKEWKKLTIVVETADSRYPKKAAIDVMNDRIAQVPENGTDIKVFFDIDAHEWEGRWFNSISAYKIEVAGAVAQQAQATTQQPVQTAPQQESQPVAQEAPAQGTLPF